MQSVEVRRRRWSGTLELLDQNGPPAGGRLGSVAAGGPIYLASPRTAWPPSQQITFVSDHPADPMWAMDRRPPPAYKAGAGTPQTARGTGNTRGRPGAAPAARRRGPQAASGATSTTLRTHRCRWYDEPGLAPQTALRSQAARARPYVTALNSPPAACVASGRHLRRIVSDCSPQAARTAEDRKLPCGGRTHMAAVASG